MSRKILIRLIGAATCVAAMTAGWDAEAGWWRRHGSSGGSWGSCGSSGGSWGSHGSSGGSYGSHGSSGGSWGSHGSSGGSWGSHGSSGGSHGSHGSSGGGHVIYHHHHPVVYHDEVVHHEPVVREKTVIVGEVVRSEPADTGKIVVELPKDAKVFINGEETTATGSSRKFISKGLDAGVTYRYDVRIVTADKDSPMEQVKVVKLTRGQTETVRFDAATATAVAPASPSRDAVAAAKVE